MTSVRVPGFRPSTMGLHFDTVTLSLDIGRLRRPTPVTSSHGDTVWCFFRTAYRFKDPRPVLTGVHR